MGWLLVFCFVLFLYSEIYANQSIEGISVLLKFITIKVHIKIYTY